MSESIKKEVTTKDLFLYACGSGTVGIMQQPAVIKSFKSEELWSMDQLNQLMPELVEAKKAHDKEVEEKGKPS